MGEWMDANISAVSGGGTSPCTRNLLVLGYEKDRSVTFKGTYRTVKQPNA